MFSGQEVEPIFPTTRFDLFYCDISMLPDGDFTDGYL